jgi:glyoxylase-like metal-dependent hydrolase (beta-lactamase superfamily II)
MAMQYAGEVRILQLEVGSYGNNCYILIDPETGKGAVIDAAAEPDRILKAVKGVEVTHILTTHRHADHWGALKEVAEATGAQVAVHHADAEALPIKPHLLLNDGDTVQVGTAPLRIIATPGHTPGSACFVTGKHLFTGDTLFPGGPGHSSSPEALRQMAQNITSKLYVLPSWTVVYPGHGAGTTIGQSKEEYAVYASKQHAADLHGDILWKES